MSNVQKIVIAALGLLLSETGVLTEVSATEAVDQAQVDSDGCVETPIPGLPGAMLCKNNDLTTMYIKGSDLEQGEKKKPFTIKLRKLQKTVIKINNKDTDVVLPINELEESLSPLERRAIPHLFGGNTLDFLRNGIIKGLLDGYAIVYCGPTIISKGVKLANGTVVGAIWDSVQDGGKNGKAFVLPKYSGNSFAAHAYAILVHGRGEFGGWIDKTNKESLFAVASAVRRGNLNCASGGQPISADDLVAFANGKSSKVIVGRDGKTNLTLTQSL
ncbi:MAG: hypothetical protein LBJ71_01245 [Holosporaceae bacterium]|nr:hypothetical protein [Holosporaceae bacterium]